MEDPSDHSTVGDSACFRRPIQTSILSPDTEKHERIHSASGKSLERL